MNGSLEQVQDLLRSEVSPLDEKAAELESALAKINIDRKRLRAALAALEGGTAKSNSKPKRKCVTKDIVIQLMEQVLTETGPVAASELNEAVRSRVKGLDYSLSGITLRIKEALKERQFGQTADGKIGMRIRKETE